MADSTTVVNTFSPPTEYYTLQSGGMTPDEWFEVTGYRAYSEADASAEAMKRARDNANSYRVIFHTEA